MLIWMSSQMTHQCYMTKFSNQLQEHHKDISPMGNNLKNVFMNPWAYKIENYNFLSK